MVVFSYCEHSLSTASQRCVYTGLSSGSVCVYMCVLFYNLLYTRQDNRGKSYLVT